MLQVFPSRFDSIRDESEGGGGLLADPLGRWHHELCFFFDVAVGESTYFSGLASFLASFSDVFFHIIF